MPLPLLPPVMLSQPALLLAVQPQPLPAITLTVPLPLLAACDRLVGEIEYVQPAPDWLTVKVLPAIVSVPLRLLVELFDATE